MPSHLDEQPLVKPVLPLYLQSILVKAVMSGTKRIIFRCATGTGFIVHQVKQDYTEGDVSALCDKLNDERATTYAIAIRTQPAHL